MNKRRFGLSVAALCSAILVIACGDSGDDESGRSVNEQLQLLESAEAKYFEQHRRYTANLADLKLLQVEGVVEQSPPIEEPWDSHLSVSTNGKLVVISVNDGDEGGYVTLWDGEQYGEGWEEGPD